MKKKLIKFNFDPLNLQRVTVDGMVFDILYGVATLLEKCCKYTLSLFIFSFYNVNFYKDVVDFVHMCLIC